MSENEVVSVTAARVSRIIDVLSMISVGNYDQNQVAIDIAHQDHFAELEQTLNIFSHELEEAQREKQAALDRLIASQKELEEKLTTIERQRMAIRDLSTPVIELWDDILTLPIVGVVDTQRSVEMTEQLLHRIVQSRARCVIIDVTGVEVVDTMTANHFIKMVNAARLLGAFCVVTGISPVIAQTLTQIGVDLRDVKTLRNLKAGLMECFLFLRSKQNGATATKTGLQP